MLFRSKSTTSLWTSRTAIISGVTITLLFTLYILHAPSPLPSDMSKSSTSTPPSSAIPGLSFTLSQVSRKPPVLLVTLKNKSPDTSYTLLKWGTPLDTAALNTNVFTLIDDESGEKVHQFALQVNRKMPPPREELVTLLPGTQEEVEVVFEKPWMPERRPARYRVKAEGEFTGVWDRVGDGLGEEEVGAYGDSPFSGREFGSNEVVMEVH